MMANLRGVKSLIKFKPNLQNSQPPLLQKLDFLPTDTDAKIFQLKPTKLPPVARTRDLLHIYGIRAKKNLSQNFLLNQRLVRGLVRAAGISPGHRVVEIGPGPGNLTRAILEKSPFECLVIEKDRRFLPLLEQLADSVLPGQLKILLGDALESDLINIFGEPKDIAAKYELPSNLPDYVFRFSRNWEDDSIPPIRLIGNLPFSISTAMLIKWLNDISQKRSFWQYGRVPMLLTFQEEVARRICGVPAAAERSRLSAMTQNYCHVDYKFKISGKSFTPNAGVDTGVVRFHPRKEPICKVPFKLFEKFVRNLFHHRNHNLLYNYRTLYPKQMNDQVENHFKEARVNPSIYPFMISNFEVGRLCDVYYRECQNYPALAEYDYRGSRKMVSESSLKVLQDAGLDLLN